MHSPPPPSSTLEHLHSTVDLEGDTWFTRYALDFAARFCQASQYASRLLLNYMHSCYLYLSSRTHHQPSSLPSVALAPISNIHHGILQCSIPTACDHHPQHSPHRGTHPQTLPSAHTPLDDVGRECLVVLVVLILILSLGCQLSIRRRMAHGTLLRRLREPSCCSYLYCWR